MHAPEDRNRRRFVRGRLRIRPRNIQVGGHCGKKSVFHAPPDWFGCSTNNRRCDPSAMVADPLEVAKTAILKNDHGSCGACESELNYPPAAAYPYDAQLGLCIS